MFSLSLIRSKLSLALHCHLEDAVIALVTKISALEAAVAKAEGLGRVVLFEDLSREAPNGVCKLLCRFVFARICLSCHLWCFSFRAARGAASSY